MAKKRKSESTGLDEIDKTMYTTFCSAANSLSQLYTQAQHQQKLAFQAGERHSLEKMYQWIVREHEAGGRLSMSDVVNYIQKELECGEEAPVTASVQQQCQSPAHQQNQTSPFNSQMPPVVSQPLLNQVSRIGLADQNKNNVFSNALSSPVRRSLQNCHVAQGGYCSPNNNSQAVVTRRYETAGDNGQSQYNEHSLVDPNNTEHNTLNSIGVACHIFDQQSNSMRDNTYGEHDSAMDMHADGPGQGFYQ